MEERKTLWEMQNKLQRFIWFLGTEGVKNIFEKGVKMSAAFNIWCTLEMRTVRHMQVHMAVDVVSSRIGQIRLIAMFLDLVFQIILYN